jgi:LemA protein
LGAPRLELRPGRPVTESANFRGEERIKLIRKIQMSARSAGLALCAAVSLSGCGYSSLRQQDEDVKASWSEVVSLYQRRADLISGLAATLKGFAASEQELIGATQAKARTGSMPAAPSVLSDPAAFASYQAVQRQLTQSLETLMGVSAGFPQLQSDANFQDLQAQLAETESSITAARDRYMVTVRNFNTTVHTFPFDVTARVFDFRPKPDFSRSAEK